MKKEPIVLAINPGSTSTKFAIYKGSSILLKQSVKHQDDQLLKFPTVFSQAEYRLNEIRKYLTPEHIQQLDAIVGRGGFLRPLSSGTYLVNEKMIEELKAAKYGEHASNLGAVLANELATGLSIPSFIVDPVVVDELEDVARLSGIVELERKSHVHALNIKAVSLKAAEMLSKPLEQLNFVVAHLGGGISVVAHKAGKLVDVNNANNEGPFSPERAGGLPAYQLVKLCYSGKYTEQEMLDKLTRKGGLFSYLGSKDIIEIEKKIENGDHKSSMVLDAMIYQVAKEIGAMATVLDGQVDRIVLTGGIAYSEQITKKIIEKVKYIAPVMVIPGEEELEALAFGAQRVLQGIESHKTY